MLQSRFFLGQDKHQSAAYISYILQLILHLHPFHYISHPKLQHFLLPEASNWTLFLFWVTSTSSTYTRICPRFTLKEFVPELMFVFASVFVFVFDSGSPASVHTYTRICPAFECCSALQFDITLFRHFPIYMFLCVGGGRVTLSIAAHNVAFNDVLWNRPTSHFS